MTKKQFMEQVTEQVREKCALPNMDVDCGVFTKNNDTPRYGIILKRRDEFISPTVYVDGLYQDYQRKKKTIPEAADEVLKVMGKVREHAVHYQSFSADFADCRDRIVYRLVSRERNERTLQSTPHLPFLDLAITFGVVCHISEQGVETMTVTNALAKQWQVGTSELVQLAEENTPRIFPVKRDTLAAVLMRYMGLDGACEGMEREGAGEDGAWERWDEGDTPMILLSNALGVNGAAVMLYPGIIQGIAEEFGSDLYILPSSIHEVIVVPDRDVGTRDELSGMVKNINDSHVCREEILSDTAYFYSYEEQRFM